MPNIQVSNSLLIKSGTFHYVRFRTAKQRLDDARRDEKLLYVTAPGVFLAEPLDMVSVKLDALGISGTFTVQEAQSGCDETGATCTLILR